jgi:hypothetical protein
MRRSRRQWRHHSFSGLFAGSAKSIALRLPDFELGDPSRHIGVEPHPIDGIAATKNPDIRIRSGTLEIPVSRYGGGTFIALAANLSCDVIGGRLSAARK